MTLAQPLVLNLFLLVPLVVYLLAKKTDLKQLKAKFFYLAIFGLAFAHVEGVLVVYLRGLRGILPQVQNLNLDLTPYDYLTPEAMAKTAQSLFLQPNWLNNVEITREAATIVMLLAAACLATRGVKERTLAFLWAFSFWDFFYYASIYSLVRWPSTFATYDVLFLIPFIWFSQVWIPLFITGTTIIIISYFLFLPSLKKRS